MQTKTDIEFIQDEDSWPQWPFLPLKRNVNGVPEFGFLMPREADPKGVMFLIFEGALMGMRVTEKQQRGAQYVTAQQVVDRGWRVD